ncbi:MAG: diguanylate cyclase [Burkholderiales bacterium]|nr:diguanylate cyclase [Burkholderiales bacterium]
MGGDVVRRWIARLLLPLACWAPHALAADPVVTLPAQQAFEFHDYRYVLLPRAAGMTPERFLKHAAESGRPGTVAFSPDNELWVRLHVRSPLPKSASWFFEVVLHSTDEAALFQRVGPAWQQTLAGDLVPMRLWPLAARYPTFPLHLEPGEQRVLVLRVRNAFPVPLPLNMATEVEAHAQQDAYSVAFGLVLGALALLAASALGQAALYRDLRYFLFAMFSLVLGLSFAALSGIGGQHLWGNLVPWTDTSKSVLPLAAGGVFVWLVSALCSLRTRSRALRRAVIGLGGAVIAVALACAAIGFVPRWAAAAGFAIAVATAFAVAVSTFRRGDPIGGWVLAGFLPMGAVTALVVLRSFGIAPFYFYGARWLSVAIALMLPFLMMALHLRTKETLALQARGRELGATDALTGLLGAALFEKQLRAAVSRFERSGHDAVVMYVRVANHSRIREVYGASLADQSMIRCAIKVQRLMSVADCIGRITEDTIGLIIEDETGKSEVQQRAAQLIAHGLMAPKGLKPELTLQLQVAANVLSANAMDAAAMHDALLAMLQGMSPRTRRPIRFLERTAPDSTSTLSEEPQSAPAQ